LRLMSFALTEQQILDHAKDVTRRLGWLHLKRGDLVRPVRKCLGLKRGERPIVLREPLLIKDVRREPLRAMLDDIDYGFVECEREGFGLHPDYRWPSGFVAMFCATHRGCTPDTVITRIVFGYD
jgi:hypothetical protein